MGAHEHQVREIGARDEQHERNRAEQHEQRQPRVADEILVQGHDERAPVFVLGGVLQREAAGDRIELRLRAGHGDARFQLGHAAVVVVVANGAVFRRPQQRRPHLHLLEE